MLKPKQSVAYLYSDYTVRQSLEKMNHYGYSAIPVISREGKYVGVVSEGDFLWYLTGLVRSGALLNERELEKQPLSAVKLRNRISAVSITADPDTLIDTAMQQNFVPVVDDLGSFIGIVTRKDIIKRLSDKAGVSHK